MKRGDLLFEVGGRPAGVVAQMTDDELLVRRHGTMTLPQGWMPASERVAASGRGMITVEPVPEAYSEELFQAAQRLRRAEAERDEARAVARALYYPFGPAALRLPVNEVGYPWLKVSGK